MPPDENKIAAVDDARTRLAQALVATGDADRAAFAQVYRLTCRKLFGICLRICGERQAAEDVLQEVYLTIWRKAGGFDPARASPITWAATIARNRAIDWRRAHRLPPPADASDAAQAVVDPGPRPGDALLASEDDRRLHRCLDALDADQERAIRTAFFTGMTYAELAASGDVPLGTVKSRIRRGLVRLRECMERD